MKKYGWAAMFALWAVGFSLLIGTTVFNLLRKHREEAPAPVPESTVRVPVPGPPPCIHEACAERPAVLRCVRGEVLGNGGWCAAYAIDYERHCVCDQWGAAPDAGAP